MFWEVMPLDAFDFVSEDNSGVDVYGNLSDYL